MTLTFNLAFANASLQEQDSIPLFSVSDSGLGWTNYELKAQSPS